MASDVEWRLTAKAERTNHYGDTVDYILDGIRAELRRLALPDGTTAAEVLEDAIGVVERHGADYDAWGGNAKYDRTARALRSLLGEEGDGG